MSAFRGPASGIMPNVHWRCMPWDDLRTHARFVGLPPVADIDLRAPNAFRFVRQEDPVWDAAHTGVLTTGMLKEALGFLDPHAARVLGLPKHMVSPGATQKVYRNLLRDAPHAQPVVQDLAELVDIKNMNAVEQYNLQVTIQPPLPPTARKKRKTNKSKHATQECCPTHTSVAASQHATKAATPANPSSKEPFMQGPSQAPSQGPMQGSTQGTLQGPTQGCTQGPLCVHLQGPLQGLPQGPHKSPSGALQADVKHAATKAADAEQEKRKAGARAQNLGSLGLGAVRCAWGSAQEASSLYALLTNYPDSTFQECGLCLVDPTTLQQRYGYLPGQLPPLGASPDGLVYHPGGPGHYNQLKGAVQGPRAPSGPLQGAQNGSADSNRNGIGKDGSINDVQISHSGTMHHCSKNGSKHGSTTDIKALLDELQLLDLAEKSRGVLPQLLPGGSNNDSPVLAVECDVEGAVEAASGGLGVVEVVEVKNTCPFKVDVKTRKNGKLKKVYSIADRGPRTEVSVPWVPQLQMEMLAANTESALLVTRSATKGLSVFRMLRDDTYIASMLQVIAFLYKHYVCGQKCPGDQPYKKLPGYHQFLLHTLALAKDAQLLLRDEDAHVNAPKTDMFLLLD